MKHTAPTSIGKESILGRSHGRGTFHVVVHDMIDPRAHRIAAQEPGIIRLNSSETAGKFWIPESSQMA